MIATAQHILDCGLHYILTVKGNQPTLQQQLRDDYHWAHTERSASDLGHGRIERRTIQVSPRTGLGLPVAGVPRGAPCGALEARGDLQENRRAALHAGCVPAAGTGHAGTPARWSRL